MISQLKYYFDKISSAGEVDPDQLLVLAQDDELLCRGQEKLLPQGAEIIQALGATSLIIGGLFLPLVEILLESSGPTAAHIIPLDTETRTFLHDIPLLRQWDDGACAQHIAEKLRHRKGVLVEGVGLVAVGGFTLEQGYVNFCSLLHATVVKVLLDLLRQPLPSKSILAGMAPLWKHIKQPLALEVDGLATIDFDQPPSILGAMDIAGRRTVELRLVDSFFGNISVAQGEGLYISQTAASLDRLSGCIDYVLNDDSSSLGLTASSELAAHRAIFAQTQGRTILHGHPRFSVILSLLCEEDCQTEDCWKDCRKVRELNGVPLVAGEVGAGGLARNLPPVMGRCGLGLVYGHGVFALGDTDFSCPLNAMLDLENWCRRHYLQLLEDLLP